jgi:two-component system, chemotaxis family, protein-glutamate methylesterase/glutaminase
MISVLVVDDSALVRRLVSGVLDDADGVRVVGTAANGEIALRKIDELRPDLVTLDIEMPVMDGLTALRELRRRHRSLPVIMISTLTHRGAAATLDSLAAGASDYITKPSNGASLGDSLADLRDQLIPRVLALGARRRIAPAPAAVHAPRAGTSAARRVRSAAPLQLVAIGSSTGGPEALGRLFAALPERPTVPIVLVQHMPLVFTTMLAARLDRLGPATVVEAGDGQRLHAGVVYLAPGGRHLEIHRRSSGCYTRLHDGEPENYSRPSVDVLFRSVAAAYPGSALALMLTGMGRDGCRGTELMAATGSLVVAQDESSSVVWGMPGAVTEAGLADAVLPLDAIAPYLAERLSAVGSHERRKAEVTA